MNSGYQLRNAASRQRLRQLLARLRPEDYQRTVRGEWTVGALLAHVAFWDDSCVVRWQEFDRKGAFTSLSIEVVDLVNDASLPTWRALPGSDVADLVTRSAAAADARTETLGEAALDYVTKTGRDFILDRSTHRNEHLDEIEALLAG